MKRIYSTILILAVAFCMAPGVYAQYQHTYEGIGDLYFPHENHNDYGSNDDIGLSKNISSPVDGKYWIKLEAYAKGSGIQTVSSTPSDVLLILDISTSMDEDYNYTDKEGTYHSGSRLSALKEATKSFIQSLYENAEASSTAAEQAGTIFDGNKVGIISYGGFVTDNTDGWKDVQASLATLNGIVDDLKINENYRGTWTSSGLRVAIDNYLDGTPYTKRSNANLTVVIFTDGEPAAGNGGNIDGQEISSGGKTFNSYIANNAVYYAYNLKNNYKAKVFTVTLLDENPDNRIIPFAQLLSSNYPEANATFQSTATWSYSGGKVSATGLTYGTDVDKYTTGYHQNVDEETDLSSIFDAIAQQSGGSTNTSLTEATSTVDIVSSSFELSGSHSASDIKIYTAPYLFNATTKQLYFGDEVLAPCSGGEGPGVGDTYIKKAWTDADGVEHPDTELDVDDAIAIDEDQLVNNIIEVTGFDYSNNWCGPITNNTGTIGAQGHKLIILIPIEMSEDAVGGPNVTTNAAGSGIWVNKETDTEPLVSFTSPTVSLPVNLSLRKEIFVSENAETKEITSEPLPSGENVKFIIMRGVITEERPDDADETWHPDYSKITSWEYVTSVFFPNRNGDDEVKIKGLPSTSDDGDYVYRIIEEDWGWTYTFYAANGQGYVKDDDDNISIDRVSIYNKKEVYSDQFVVNPILFINKNENIDQRAIRHAESKVTNTFLESLGDDKVKQENSR